MVEAHAVEVRAEADVVLALDPVEVRHVLGLWVVAVVRHEVRVHAQRSESVACLAVEFRPATLERPRSVGSWNAQHVRTNLFAQPGLLRGGVLTRPAEVGVHNEVGRERICAHNRKSVGPAMTVPWITRAYDSPSSELFAHHSR